jgi:hypothetical protein
MTQDHIDEYAGLRRQFEVGLRFAPTRMCAAAAAKSVASVLDAHPQVPARLVDLSHDGSRVLFTVSVCTIDAVKTAAPSSRRAIALLQELIDSFAAYDPAFVQLPVTREGRRASMVGVDLRDLQTVG